MNTPIKHHKKSSAFAISDTANTSGMMAVKVTLSNYKGGVGKTTSSVNVSAGLALAGKKIGHRPRSTGYSAASPAKKTR